MKYNIKYKGLDEKVSYDKMIKELEDYIKAEDAVRFENTVPVKYKDGYYYRVYFIAPGVPGRTADKEFMYVIEPFRMTVLLQQMNIGTEAAPMPDYALKLFDKYGFTIDSWYSKETGQVIEDWF